VIRWLRHKVGGQAVVDTLAWFVAIFLAGLLRYEFDASRLDVAVLSLLGIVLSTMSFVFGELISLYRGRHRVASFDELLALLMATAAATAPTVVVVFLWGNSWGIPRSIVLIATPLFLLMSGGVRAYRRFLLSRINLSEGKKRALIYGAGEMSEYLIPQLQSDPAAEYSPVGLLDDDPLKVNRWISGVKMLGTIRNLESAARDSNAEVLIVAIPRVESFALGSVYESARRLGLEVAVLPSFTDVLNRKEIGVALRKLTIDDLIGRRAVSIETSQVSAYLQDKTVLITGAGGSIGVELCRQVASFSPKELVFLDRDETGLQLAQLAIENSGLLETPNAVLADIRDEVTIREVFETWKPQIVFHAAALKHLPVLERHPQEAWKTNVTGTLNVLNASAEIGVEAFINISTDKAADPSSILGKSKRIAEQLTAWAGSQNSGSYLSVRFGNVLGSRGSLVPTVAHLIEAGGPVTITHPDATRYFMTIPEACQLVLQAGVSSDPGSVYVLDMGEPVRVLDVISRMIEMSGRKIDVIYTGLRAGEKLHEVLHSEGASLDDTAHPLISKAFVTPVRPDELEGFRRDFGL
jgi:FlaA1/EpsC-like NDP-sugar epimerase